MFQVPSNVLFLFTVLSIWLIPGMDTKLEKNKNTRTSLEINTRFDTFRQKTSITDKSSETLQIQAVDPNNKSKPQFEKYCSFCHENNHSVSTCYP